MRHSHMMSHINATETPRNDTDVMWLEHIMLPNLLLGTCFLVGMPGIGSVVWTILTKFPQCSLTVVLILNLAMADLMALLTVPFWMYNFAGSWALGEPLCKFLTFLVYFTLYASIFLIVLLSLQRFAVVVFPMDSQRWRKPRVMHCTLLAVWCIAAAFASPNMIFTSSETSEGECTDEVYASETQQIVDNVVETLFSFVIPFAVLLFCYSCVARRVKTLKWQKKMKTGNLIAAVVRAFFVCWLPYHVFNVLTVSRLLLKHNYPDVENSLLKTSEAVAHIHWSIAFLNSCLNPILYAFAARSFCNGLRETNFAKLFAKMHEDTAEKPTGNNTVSLQPCKHQGCSAYHLQTSSLPMTNNDGLTS